MGWAVQVRGKDVYQILYFLLTFLVNLKPLSKYEALFNKNPECPHGTDTVNLKHPPSSCDK